jgi:hypothetical protein
MQVMFPLSSRVRFQPDSARKRSRNRHEAHQLCTVDNPDNGQRRCPKYVEFYDKNKFWILMHLVGYFYDTYHDARSPENKVNTTHSEASFLRVL